MNAGRASILSIPPKTAITNAVSNVHRLANDNDEAIVVIATMMVRFVLSAVGVSRKKSLCQNSVMGSRLGHHYIQVAERIRTSNGHTTSQRRRQTRFNLRRQAQHHPPRGRPQNNHQSASTNLARKIPELSSPSPPQRHQGIRVLTTSQTHIPKERESFWTDHPLKV